MSATLPWSQREMTIENVGGWPTVKCDGVNLVQFREDTGKWISVAMQQDLDGRFIHPFFSWEGERQITGWAEDPEHKLPGNRHPSNPDLVQVTKGWNWQRVRCLPVFVAADDTDNWDVP